MSGPPDRATLTGLEIAQAMIAGTLPQAPIAGTLDFRLVTAAHGHVVFEGMPAEAFMNPFGSVHGGWIATLLDSAMTVSVLTTLDVGLRATTLELKINYVRALRPDHGPVRAEGRVIHAGRQISTAEGRLIDADGRVLAHGSTTCLVFATA